MNSKKENNTPFTSMSKQEFLAFLDEAGIKHEDANGPGRVIFEKTIVKSSYDNTSTPIEVSQKDRDFSNTTDVFSSAA